MRVGPRRGGTGGLGFFGVSGAYICGGGSVGCLAPLVMLPHYWDGEGGLAAGGTGDLGFF